MRVDSFHIEFRTISKRKAVKIRIANPVHGEARFTSAKRAKQHCASGLACLNDKGELFFYDNQRVVRRQREFDEASHAIRRYRGGVVFWNGTDDPLERNRPGQVRS